LLTSSTSAPATPLDITTDVDGNPRFVDDPDTPDTGNPGPPGPIVDMGAYELQVVDDDDSSDDSDDDSDD